MNTNQRKKSFISQYNLSIPMGIDNNGHIVEITLGEKADNYTNGYQVFTPDETHSINYIIKNAYKKYSPQELWCNVLHCDAYYDIPINAINEAVVYQQVKSYRELYNQLLVIKDEIEHRMDLMQEKGTRTLDMYQEVFTGNEFSQIVVVVNELFHLTENMNKQDETEQEFERLSLALIRDLSRRSYRFGVYFLLIFRYSLGFYSSRYLGEFDGSVYCAHYSGEVEYENKEVEQEVKCLQKDEFLVLQNRQKKDCRKCKAFKF